MAEITHRLSVCVDCLLAYHYPGEQETPPEVEPWSNLGRIPFSALGCACEGGNGGEWGCTDSGSCDTFSWRQCDGCGSHLGGERHEFVAFDDV
jgi:hypothetical protein